LMANQNIKRLSIILVVALMLTMIPTFGFAQEEVDTTKVEAFVARLYKAALDREPDADGLKYWTRQLATKKQTAAQAITFILIESKEFNEKGLSDDEFLVTVYGAFFNRAADASGFAYWKSKLEEGYSRRWVIQQMVGAMSGEFQALCEEAGIVPGKVGGVTEKDLALKVESVAATNKYTVVVNFSKEVGNALASHFSVNLKDDEFALNVIESVTVDKKVVTIKLVEALEDGKEYVLNVANLPAVDGSVARKVAKEFKYTENAPVSISVKHTTLASGEKLEYVIKDAHGNDITDNFDESSIVLESSDDTVIDDTTFIAGLPGGKSTAYAIVNLKIADTEIESGNIIVTVKDTLALLTSINRWSLSSGDYADNPVTELFKSTTGLTIDIETLDQNGDFIDVSGGEVTYRSLNPTVLVVDAEDGTVYPVSVGKANVLITAELNGRKVTKTITITVKADPEAKSIKVDPATVKLVEGSGIVRTVDVEILDQYGNTYDADDTITVKMSKNGIVDEYGTTAVTEGLTDGKVTLVLTPGTEKAAGTLTIEYGSLKKTVSVSLVAPAEFVGYAAEATATNLDVVGDDDFGPSTATVSVFEKDKNGNFIAEVTSNVSLVSEDESKVAVTGMTVTAVAPGTVKVHVYVGTAKVQTLTFKVVNSTPVLTKVSQVKNAVTVTLEDDNLEQVLFGTDANGGAFVGYDQYGNKIQIDEWQALSSRRAVVDTDLSLGEAGTVTLTLLINDKPFTIVVKVVD